MENPVVGLIGVLGIWLTAGVCLPLVKTFNDNNVKPEQLMIVRGVVTMLLSIPLAGTGVFNTHWPTMAAAACFALACLGLFKGVVTWGAGRTIAVVTATPVINMFLHPLQITSTAVLGFVFMAAGVVMAIEVRQSKQHKGLAWSIFGTVMNGLFYEFLSAAESNGVWTRCFWQACAVAALGLCLSYGDSWGFLASFPELRWQLPLWAFIQGFLYFLANIVAFDTLPLIIASTLAQGETPAVIIMAEVLVHEKMNNQQWAGVGLALVGASLLTVSLMR